MGARRGTVLRTVVVIASAIALAACGTQVSPGAEPTNGAEPGEVGTQAPTPNGLDVTSLVGNWFVQGDDVESGTTVTVAFDEFRVWQECGAAMAPWRGSTNGLFAAAVSSWSGSCEDKPDLPWLETAMGWRPDGASIVLVDASEQELARLDPGATPTAAANVAPQMAVPPVVTDETRAILNASPSLGPGLTSGATRSMLVGSWIAIAPSASPVDGLGPPADAPGFTLKDDGTWSGTDGCNGSGGRWNADTMSGIIATSGGSTLIGCNNVAAPQWLAQAWLAGFDTDDVLVLFDYQGTELGRLTRG